MRGWEKQELIIEQTADSCLCIMMMRMHNITAIIILYIKYSPTNQWPKTQN